MITSGETNVVIYLNQNPVVLSLFDITKLTDTTSLVCGDGTGLTYCGDR